MSQQPPSSPAREDWETGLFNDLVREDPRLAVVWNHWVRDFHRDCTAAQLRRFLREVKGCRWLPGDQWFRRWFNTVTSRDAQAKASAMRRYEETKL